MTIALVTGGMGCTDMCAKSDLTLEITMYKRMRYQFIFWSMNFYDLFMVPKPVIRALSQMNRATL